MTDGSGSASGEESPAMREFLAQRRVDVLRRAIITLETCAPDELAGEAHRLAGTLGVFGFDDASTALRSLQRHAATPEGAADEIDERRVRTLAILRGIHDGVISEDCG